MLPVERRHRNEGTASKNYEPWQYRSEAGHAWQQISVAEFLRFYLDMPQTMRCAAALLRCARLKAEARLEKGR